jgi:type I restriction enzyme S subunit
LTSNQQKLSEITSRDIDDLDSETRDIAERFYHNIPEDWGFDKLDNIVSEFIDYRGKTPPKSEEGVHMLSAANIKDGFILPKRKEKFVTKKTWEEWTTKGKPQKDDVIVTTEAPVGEVGLIRTEETFLTAQRLITLRCGKNIDSRYLKFCLQYERTQKQLGSYASGTTVSGFNQTDLRNTVVPLPELDEQRKFGQILDNIEEKIVLNNEVKKRLKSIAQSIFDYWFVNFEPHKQFTDTEVGRIPEKFRLEVLEDVLSFQRGYSYSGDEMIDEDSDKDPSEGYPMVNLGNIGLGGGYRPKNIKYCENIPNDRYLIEPGDLVISHTDMTQDQDILGSPVIIPNLNKEPILFSHHLYAIRDTDLPKEYLYYYFLSPYFKPKAESFASGTTVLSFSSKITSDVQIPIPPQEDLDEYEDAITPIFQKIENIRQENESLIELRDTLLPKLMSGEVKVNDISLDNLGVDSEV